MTHIPNGAVKPAMSASIGSNPGLATATARVMIAEVAIAAYDLVYESGESGGLTQVSPADADAILSVQPPLYVALHAAIVGQEVHCHPGPITVPLDTTGRTVGDLVYASNTAGGVGFAAGTYPQPIGAVRKVGTVAAGGSYTFHGAMASALSTSSTSGMANGTAAAPGWPFLADTDTGFYRLAANIFAIALGGVAALGLGATTPTIAAAADTAGAGIVLKVPDAGSGATAARTGAPMSLVGGDGSAGSGTIAGGAGGSMALAAGAGGSKTGTVAAAGGAGGAQLRNGGAGGSTASTSTGAGGAGGGIVDTSGAGGAATGAGSTGNGGAGGTLGRSGGIGGASIGGTGGAGGAITDITGTGGTSTTGAGGAGGAYTATTGTGGAATGGTGNGGAGGDFNVVLGAGGASAGGTAGRQGQVMVQSVALHIDHDMRYTASSVDQTIFIAQRACRVVGIRGVPDVAGTDGGAVTATIRKVPSGTAITAGNALHSGTYNLKGAADTVQTLTLTSTVADLILAAGDKVCVDFGGVLTSAVGCISVATTPQ